MVFSSVPLYLDPPNWQQQPPDQHQVGDNRQNETTHHHILHQHHPQHLPILPPLPQQQPQTNGVLPSSQIPTGAATTSSPTSTTSNRPTSMSERARLAKMIPQHAPDGGPLKCPRCESTNTKFCYFNNYSLSQPRHFCKTCRRYWTLGGALRNVPVGGGCRRNNSKRCSKGASGSRLKSPAVSSTSVPHEEQQQQQSVGQHGGGNISSTALLSQFAGLNNNCSNVNPPSQFSFMGSLQNLTAQLGIGSSGNNLGLGMRFGSNGRIDQMGQLDFGGILQQQQQHAQHQQQQQLPLLSGFGLYPFQNETTTTTTSMYGGGRGSTVPEMFITRPPKTSESVKMEEMQGGIQLGHHPSLSKEQQLSSGEQSTDHHHHPQDHNRSSGTPHLWVGNNNSANNNNNNTNSNSNGLVSATSANNLWTDLSGLN